MRKVLFGLTLLVTAAVLPAEEFTFFNAATGNQTMSIVAVPGSGAVQGYVETFGSAICECQISSAAGAVATVTLEGATSPSGPWVVLYTATNPAVADPNNYVFGSCPKFARGVIAGYASGTITMKFNSKK